MFIRKSLVAALVLVTFATAFVTPNDASAWGPRHHRGGHAFVGAVVGGLIGGAIASRHCYRPVHTTYVAPVSSDLTLIDRRVIVDEYGRTVIVRSYYNPVTGQVQRTWEYAD